VVREIESVLRPSINFEIQLGFSPRIGLGANLFTGNVTTMRHPPKEVGRHIARGELTISPYIHMKSTTCTIA